MILLLAAFLPAEALAAPLRAILTRTLETGGRTGYYTSLALNAAGYPVISYINANTNQLSLVFCEDPGCSNPTIKTLDSASLAHTSLVLDAAGNPVVSYYSFSNELKLARCTDPLCNSVTINVVDGSGSAGSYSSLRLTSAGLPVISYRANSPAALKLARCSDLFCNDPATLHVLDNANNPGFYTSLALDDSDRPVVSYYNLSAPARDLMLARCDQPDCTTFVIRTLDSIGEVGAHSSLELDPDGFPVISYADTTNDHLKLAHCNDASCSSASLAVVDGSIEFGSSISLELDRTNQPVISYSSNSDGSLKLARCNDLDCTNPILTILDHPALGGAQYNSLKLDCANNPVISYQLFIFGTVSTSDLMLLNDDSTDCTTAVVNDLASKPIELTGTTTLELDRIMVSVPASAIPPGQTGCVLVIQEAGSSAAFGFALDDAVWDVKIRCNNNEIDLFFDALTVCIRPHDGVTANKNIYHNHNATGFQAMNAEVTQPGYACGQTRLLSLFTLGQLALPNTGFAPGRVSVLAEQPAEYAYAATDLALSIPKLGVELDIVGVPQGVNGWDVSWLSQDQAGYLYGTSFPTWQGNSVLTAHVWNADNMPGPFYALRSLQQGDQFTITAYGYTYVYEVRSNQLVLPSSLRPLADSDYSLITLITCESYSEAADGYLYRRAVQAVLVDVH